MKGGANMQTLLTIVLICVMAFVALVGILIYESKENGKYISIFRGFRRGIRTKGKLSERNM